MGCLYYADQNSRKRTNKFAQFFLVLRRSRRPRPLFAAHFGILAHALLRQRHKVPCGPDRGGPGAQHAALARIGVHPGDVAACGEPRKRGSCLVRGAFSRYFKQKKAFQIPIRQALDQFSSQILVDTFILTVFLFKLA